MDILHQWCCKLTPHALKLTQLLPSLELGRSHIPHEPVPLSFRSADQYRESFLHLFLKEAKAQLEKAWQEEDSSTYEVQLIGVQSEPPFKILSLSTSAEFGHHDLLCLEKDEFKILGVSQNLSGLKVKVLNEAEGTTALIAAKSFKISKVASLPTIQREFNALHNLQSIPILNQLLKPEATSSVQFSIARPLKTKLKELFNTSQLAAIKSALKKQGITLIQGPPGTGKTVTLIGTLSVMLHSRKPIHKQLPLLTREHSIKLQRQTTAQLLYSGVDWRDQLFQEFDFEKQTYTLRDECFPKASETDRIIKLDCKREKADLPSQILICGPSNGSVDEIIRKIEQKGLINEKGESFVPMLVRVGQNFNPELEKYSIDFIAQERITRLGLDTSDDFRVKQSILQDTQLVCTTLNSAGSYILANSGLKFDTVVIDQACQAVEPLSLVPLVYGCKRLILIGDPNQLPSTIFSKEAVKLGYDLSLFERLMKCGVKVVTLSEQYRMHPDIVQLISQEFYQGRIKSAPGIASLLPTVTVQTLFSPLMFVHIPASQQQFFKESYRNRKEAAAVLRIVEALKSATKLAVSVITPYSQQVVELNKLLKKVQIKTVDSFQGRQKQAIVFNSVRASRTIQKGKERDNSKSGIGFLKDSRRLNVALSRARAFCVVVGDGSKLLQDSMWKRLITHIAKAGGCVQYSEGKELFKRLQTIDQIK